jgi:hypothetical protein
VGTASTDAGPTTTTTAKRSEPPKPPTSPSGEVPRDTEQLALTCTGGRVEGVGAVTCQWSPSHAPTFARYVLWRQDPGQTQKRVIFQSTDRNVVTFTDKPLDAGNHYYGLLALDGSSKGVGNGGPVSATVPPPPTTTTTAPKAGTTSLACTVQTQGVVCTWPASTSERFAGYRLYREVPGTPAQVRFTTTDRGVTTATDGDVTPGATYKYRIVVMGTDGNPLAYGGPVTITIPPGGAGDAPKP